MLDEHGFHVDDRPGPPRVSYESYNYPGGYVRHWEYLLNVQAVSTATDRADAAFYAE
ncbi:AbfB domain-containing protein [Streptomyces coeruleorubidus]|uniref:AbfB domain-containing protein n=1 Tax=Streptomyces coeruleorubidus TaxID=116188 RepID=UPI0018745AB7|nr:hypothetical protein GCM10010244_18810 [Streptomyces bellus]